MFLLVFTVSTLFTVETTFFALSLGIIFSSFVSSKINNSLLSFSNFNSLRLVLSSSLRLFLFSTSLRLDWYVGLSLFLSLRRLPLIALSAVLRLNCLFSSLARVFK
uniref:Uncharacterized protein n=1 Tax=Cacopsylla melanoneura TaxID=428564 RepID=A0A8D8TFK7_9HEMI